jgi:hypothetical protein
MQPGDLVLGSRFIVVAANPPVAAKSISERGQPGFYLIQTEPSPGSFVRFSGSSESAVLDRGASWVHDQSRRKDGGVLTASAPRHRHPRGRAPAGQEAQEEGRGGGVTDLTCRKHGWQLTPETRVTGGISCPHCRAEQDARNPAALRPDEFRWRGGEVVPQRAVRPYPWQR